MKIKVLLTLVGALAIASTALADTNLWSSKTNAQTNTTAKKAVATPSTAKNPRYGSTNAPTGDPRRPNLVEKMTPTVPETNQPTPAIIGAKSDKPLPPIHMVDPTPIPNAGPDSRTTDPSKMTIYFFNCAMCHGDDAKGQTRFGQQYGCKDHSTKESWKNLSQEKAIRSVLEGLQDPDTKRTLMHAFKDRFVPNQAYGAVKEMQALAK